MTKYIFITGGVVSSLGKGIVAASLGRLLRARGFSVINQKCDPYINVDPGTMSPFQHGEVFVTDDGAETDLDLGHYERFTDTNLGKYNNVTSGSVYQHVIQKERKGDYLGGTVQVIPHITNEIKSRILGATKQFKPDFQLIEIGGTIGDIESLPFIEAIRQFKSEVGIGNAISIHCTLLPYLPTSGELKTKPSQHSVNVLRSYGIQPEVLVCRTSKPIPKTEREKLALFCSVPTDAVLECRDMKSIYETKYGWCCIKNAPNGRSDSGFICVEKARGKYKKSKRHNNGCDCRQIYKAFRCLYIRCGILKTCRLL